MTVEEIAKRLCEHTHCKLAAATASYSPEQYWEKNKEYFIRMAETYLDAKRCLEEGQSTPVESAF